LHRIFKTNCPMTKSTLVLAFVCAYSYAFAQQLPLFTQYRDNLGIINPAAPHFDFLTQNKTISVGATYRKQWVGLDNAPVTQVLRYEHIMAYTGNSFSPLFGAYVMRDVTGPLSMTGLYGKFGAALTEDAESGGISAAISGGLVAYTLDTDKIKVRDADDIVVAGRRNKLFPDVGLGIYYWKKLDGRGFFEDDMLSGGISVPQTLGLNLQFKDDGKTFSTRRVQHFYGQFSWLHSIEDMERFIQPSIWVKYAINAPVNVDMNVRYQLAPAMWIGAGASSGGNFHAETGFNIGENAGVDGLLKIGYGFDYSYSRIGPYAGSTHEFNVIYSFGGK
jgi:type IX secretion system PorP/SprF family membrane protein